MSIFSKYRVFYKEPERTATDSTSRALRVLERERRRIEELDQAALQGRGARLSQASKEYLNRVQNLHARLMSEHKADIESAAARDKGAARARYAAMSGLLQRERLNKAKLARAASERAKASAADRRSFHPSRSDLVNPRTVFGTEALIGEAFRARLGVR